MLTELQRKLAEQLLISVIKKEPYVEYNELANRISPPIFHRQVGKEIGKISELCHKLGLPLLSAKVISKGQRTAGAGFFELMKSLGRYDPTLSHKELFDQELSSVRNCSEWYKLADYLDLDLPLPRPENAPLSIKQTSTTTPNTTSWIFPCNAKTYDVIGAFSEFAEIDWRQSVKCNPGDTVYIYCSKPYQKIIYKTTVIKSNIPASEANMSDEKYWIEKHASRNDSKFGYTRLMQTAAYDGNALTLPLLLNNGLSSAPQGPLKASDELVTYLDAVFEHTLPANPYFDSIDDYNISTLVEGSVKQITINAYERNPIARKKCIAIHGAKCAICDFDFSSFYGKNFEGLIHVHHLKPLHTLGEEYIVNPETDLIPVCPNCHLALHSKKTGVYSPDELKAFMTHTNK